jgi:chaperone modulatory protein CbpM
MSNVNNEMTATQLLDEYALGLDEFARACGREPQWVLSMVESDYFGSISSQASAPQFNSDDLIRAKRFVHIASTFETNEEATAFVVDLLEEVARLRHALKLVQF